MRTRATGTLRRTARMLSLGLAASGAALVLTAAPASAFPSIGSISARLTIFPSNPSGPCGPNHLAVNVHGQVATRFGSGQELINAGYGVKIEGWGEDPVFDNREFGPYVLRGTDLGLTTGGMSYNLRRCVSKSDLNEDEDGADELYAKAWLLDGKNREVRNIESRTVQIVVQR